MDKKARLAFIYDGPLFKDNENNYYGISITEEMLSRYYFLAEEIDVYIRVFPIGHEIEKYHKISLNKFTVHEIPNLFSLKGFLCIQEAENIINDCLAHVDIAVIRIPGMIGNVAIRCCKKKGIPFITEVVGCAWDAFWNHSLKGKMIALPMMMLTKSSVKKSDFIYYVTSQFLQRRYPSHGKSIACSNVIIEIADQEIIKKKLSDITDSKEAKTIIIGTTAAVDVKYKGHEDVIRAMYLLRRKGIANVRYEMIGEGNNAYLSGIAESLGISEQVKFLGQRTHADVIRWLDTIDIYIQPSRQEGLPRALIEAMSRGLLAIGTSVGGIPELLDENYVYSKGNVKKLASILVAIDATEQKEQGWRNYEVSKQYGKNVLESRRREFYKEVLELI